MEIKVAKAAVNNINKEILQDQVLTKSIDDFNYIFLVNCSQIDIIIKIYPNQY